MNDKLSAKITKLNGQLQKIFSLQELKNKKLKQCLFEEAIVCNDAIKNEIAIINNTILTFKNENINIKLYCAAAGEPPADYLLIKNFNELIYFINHLVIPDSIVFIEGFDEENTISDCESRLRQYCIENNLPIPKCKVQKSNL